MVAPYSGIREEKDEFLQNDLIKSLKDKELLIYSTIPSRAGIAYCRLVKMGYPHIKKCDIDEQELDNMIYK